MGEKGRCQRASSSISMRALILLTMAPENVDIASLSAQLADDWVAFETDNPVNLVLEPEILRAVNDANAASPETPIGVVVLETIPVGPGALRDLGQELLAQTEADTIIVRAPGSTAAVSHSLTRAEVESAEFALISEPDYAKGVDAFVADAATGGPAWSVVAAVSMAMVVAAAAGTAFSVRKLPRANRSVKPRD